jgi:transcriptional regulator with XRE-family HTH domain
MLEYKYMNSGNIDTKNKKDAGDKLRDAREKLGLTQAEVAKKAKMTVNYYAMIERGEVNLTFDKIQSIVQALKLKITIS